MSTAGRCGPCPNNPPCTLRGTGWNRWEWLCRDPQLNTLVPFDTLIDSVLVVKDNHRPLLQRPLDQTAVLPPGKHQAPQDGAPRWMPACVAPDPDGPPPIMAYRTCSEIARIKDGCGASAAPQPVGVMPSIYR